MRAERKGSESDLLSGGPGAARPSTPRRGVSNGEDSPASAAPSNGPGRRLPELDGRSAAWRTMLDWARRASRSRLPVLVYGETGSGKEAIARWIHERSPRAGGPFVPLNCTALPDSLLEAELFGALRGAYTGADRDRAGLFLQADRGTLFLDEVGDMSPAMQAKLLRALEERRVRPVGGAVERPVDVRVVAATHRDLARAVASGLFRADLYHRLAVLEVRVPPLRQRLEDLPLLVQTLRPRILAETGAPDLQLCPSAWKALAGHPWPGNVRQLHAVLARAALRCGGRPIRDVDLELSPARAAPTCREGQMIQETLAACGGNVSAAARAIGWTRQKLYRRMRALAIRPPGP